MTPGQSRRISRWRMMWSYRRLARLLYALARQIAAAYEDREIDVGEEQRLSKAFIDVVRQAKPPR